MSFSKAEIQELYPKKLSAEERENPEMVFKQFFTVEIDDLPVVKERLWQVFDDLTKRKYKHKPGTVGYENSLYFFEKMEKLLEAAWVMSKQGYASAVGENTEQRRG